MKPLINSALPVLFLLCLSITRLSAQGVTQGEKYYSNPKMGIIPTAPTAYNDTLVVSKSDDLIVELTGEMPDTTKVDTSKGSFDKDKYYDYEYAARIYRFHRGMGFGYYDDWYTDMYWYTGNPYYWGTSIYCCWDPFWDYPFGWSWYWGGYYPYFWGGYYYPYYWGGYYGWGGYAWIGLPGDPGHQYLGGNRNNNRPPTSRTTRQASARTQMPTMCTATASSKRNTVSNSSPTRYSKPESITRNRSTQTMTRNSGARTNSARNNTENYRNSTTQNTTNSRFDNSRSNARSFENNNSRTNTRTTENSRTNTQTFDNSRQIRNTGNFNNGSSFRSSSPSTGRGSGFSGGGSVGRRR